MRDLLDHHLRNAITRMIPSSHPFKPELTIPGKQLEVDLATNAPLTLAQGSGEDPISIAEGIIASLAIDRSLLEKIEIAAPGYINVRFSTSCYSQELIALEEREIEENFPEEYHHDRWGDSLQRAVGILRHARSLGLTPPTRSPLVLIDCTEEIELVRRTLHLHDTMSQSNASDESCRHAATHLASAIDGFYYRCRVVASPEPDDRMRRIRILTAAARTLQGWITTRHRPRLESGL